MISVEEALSRILAPIQPLPAEIVALPDALGRVLAADAVARVTQPPAAVSAMDGYAVRACDVSTVPTVLRRVGEAPAGGSYDRVVREGEAVRIFTGAPLPQGADAIVIQEDTEADGDRILIKEAAEAGRFVRPAGLDFSAGQTGLPAGTLLTVRAIGLAAAMNLPWLTVHRRPRVAILATGNEIVRPGDPVGPNQIVSSNSFALAGLVRAMGGTPVDLGVAADTRESLLACLEGARDVDLLVTTGGASVGDYDIVRDVLGERGFELDFYKIAMRPGKPLTFGRFGTVPVLGLPGNPVSSAVCALLFLCPALRKLQGLPPSEGAPRKARLGADLPANDRRQEYRRATLFQDGDGQTVATPFANQDSSILSKLAQADCLVIRPPFAPPAKIGDVVEILPFGTGTLIL